MEDHFELQEFMNNVPAEQRNAVFEALMGAEIIKDALNTPQGKAILQEAVTVVAGSVGQIVGYALDGFEKNTEQIKQKCLEIKITETMMRKWAMILQEADRVKS